MLEGTGLIEVKKKLPGPGLRRRDRRGARRHLAGGMAKAGWKPVVSIYSTFLQRSFDQLIHDVALQNLPRHHLHRPRRARRRRRQDAPGRLRHLLHARDPEHDRRGAEGRERAAAHPLHGDLLGPPLRGALPARPRARRRARPGAQDDPDRQGRDPARGHATSCSSPTARWSRSPSRPPRSSGGAASPAASRTPASPSRSTSSC